MRHFAATKPNCGLYFIPFLQPLTGVLHAIVVVVIVRARSKFHFLNSNRYLLFLGLVGLFLGFVLKLSEVNNSANRRVGSGGNLHKVQTFFSGGANGVSNIQYTELLTFLANNPYLWDANSLVNTGDRQAPVIRTLAATSKACSYCCTSSFKSPKSRVDIGLRISQRTHLDKLARHSLELFYRHHPDVTL